MFDVIQTIATVATFTMAAFGSSLIGAGFAFSMNKPTKKVWLYGAVGCVVGMIVSAVSYW